MQEEAVGITGKPDDPGRTSGKPDRERYTRGGRSGAARPQCDDADDGGSESGRTTRNRYGYPRSAWQVMGRSEGSGSGLTND
jgi:hypothetical protein